MVYGTWGFTEATEYDWQVYLTDKQVEFRLVFRLSSAALTLFT